MKQITARYLNATELETLQDVSHALSLCATVNIDCLSWPEYGYKPFVVASIAYDDANIYLKYTVQEKELIAWNTEHNTNVFQDSCVEFFIAFTNDDAYYNLEFNSIGACRFGFGNGRLNRKLLPEKQIELIGYYSSIKLFADVRELEWQLTVKLPYAVFAFHNITSLRNVSCRANFYKCGDLLNDRHFLSWNRVETPTPDFHVPRSFGRLLFC